MTRRIASIALIALLAGSMTSCIFDPEPKKKDDVVAVDKYEDLTEEWHVLNNLAQAYDDKNIDRYSELFDPVNFVFFFNPGDVGGEFNIPVQWGFAEDIQSATNMFSSAGGLEDNPILTIDLTLFDIEQAQWTDTSSPEFPGETLRQVTVPYDYFIDTVQDRQFITSGSPQAQFVVRQIDGKWKLVQWFDLDGV